MIEFRIITRGDIEHRVAAQRVIRDEGSIVFGNAVGGLWNEVARFPCEEVDHVARAVTEYVASTRWVQVDAQAPAQGIQRPAAFG